MFDLAEVHEFTLLDLNAKIRSTVGCSNATVEAQQSIKEIKGNAKDDNIASVDTNADDDVSVSNQENNSGVRI